MTDPSLAQPAPRTFQFHCKEIIFGIFYCCLTAVTAVPCIGCPVSPHHEPRVCAPPPGSMLVSLPDICIRYKLTPISNCISKLHLFFKLRHTLLHPTFPDLPSLKLSDPSLAFCRFFYKLFYITCNYQFSCYPCSWLIFIQKRLCLTHWFIIQYLTYNRFSMNIKWLISEIKPAFTLKNF